MSVSYSTLLERVGQNLFGVRSGLTADQTSDVEDCISDGLRDVYTAHSWSFLRPLKQITTVEPYTTGTVTIVAGVVTLDSGTFPSWAASGVLEVDNDFYVVSTRDGNTQVTLTDTSATASAGSSYKLSRYEYDLPTGFESIEGPLTYEPGKSDFYPPVEFRHDDEVRRLLQDNPECDRPKYFSIRTVEFDPTEGSLRRIAFYPTPDDVYVLTARMNLRPVGIDSTNEYPIGAEILSQVILEACLAAAERNFDDGNGVHTKRFFELLPLAIQQDKEASTPTTLGPDRSESYSRERVPFTSQMGDVTFNGTIM
jgi:hypothetical protein